jgi:perosamine synthetase
MAILTGSIPNIQSDDLIAAREILDKEKSISNERFVLESILEKLLDTKNILILNRGRDVLYVALKALGIQEKDSVLIQAFTCIAVPTPIIWLGANPKYIDIDPNTFNMDLECFRRSISDKTKAVIIQHTFGNFQDMKSVKEIIDTENKRRELKDKIYIIEDCAHLFPTNIENTDILKYSDAAIFSFAQDKAISCTQGGLVIFKDDAISKKAIILYGNTQEQNEKEAQYNARYILKWDEIKKEYFKPLLNTEKLKRFTIGKFKIILYRYLRIIKKQAEKRIDNIDSIKRLSNEQAHLLLNQIKKIQKYNNNRKEITKIYDKLLNAEFRFKGHSSSLIRYPILVSNPDEVLNALGNEKIISGRWYATPVFPLTNNFSTVEYISGSCRKAEICGKCIVNLPTDINVNSAIAGNISYIVNKVARPIKI